ncbi:hypothetical protein YB2330_005298 [Saitoella coloradoensis]
MPPSVDVSAPSSSSGLPAGDGDTLPFIQYLLHRLRDDLHINSIFGVPGDFNLPALDYVEDFPGMKWIGAVNELNGGYAADGYARVKGAGALVTTFGVGELSAMNAHAGAYAEQIPLIHLVGLPSTSQLSSSEILHHSLGHPHQILLYSSFFKEISGSMVVVSETTRAKDIDRALEIGVRRCLPVYIALPQDLVEMPLKKEGLNRPLVKDIDNLSAAEMRVISEILGLLSSCSKPIIIADAGASRDNISAEVSNLISSLPTWPLFVSAMGKGSVNEQHPSFAGTYMGTLSLPPVRTAVEAADFVLSIGALASDFNTGFGSMDFEGKVVVELHATWTSVDGSTFPGVGMKSLLPRLASSLSPITSSAPMPPSPSLSLPLPIIRPASDKFVRHAYFWPRVEKWLREDDVLCVEAGTSSFGAADVRLPRGATMLAQWLWASIGFSVGATVGAAVAAAEGFQKNVKKRKAEEEQTVPSSDDGAIENGEEEMRRRRVICVVGDGALQMGIQEISNLVRYDLCATIFVVDNRGYTVEKYIRGITREYNAINTGWDYSSTLSYFGSGSSSSSSPTSSTSRVSTHVLNTEFELDEFLTIEANADPGNLRLVIVRFEDLDAPRMLKMMAGKMGRMNDKGDLVEGGGGLGGLRRGSRVV